MSKRLSVDVVRKELELLAAGANGGAVELDPHGEWPTLLQYLPPDRTEVFAWAVRDRFFPNDVDGTFLFSMTSASKWETFESLANEICKERKRLDQMASVRAGGT
ncbi:hypothetical protein [Planctomyces sp. SH-PL14]|uniref:hypothetical protein n=1 Tax=Planctomyces sp. SH-PL14 TaxID=1632864 RepID=UPI00078B660B|nr:hypothetical protein [Planctomyces sp. SH-PL14]AMV18886.1 hypothetical protein VT03_13435 [Planctomyces sp. SH-PL14]